jgi:NAD(P)-dependent dehydrogenase (short-subunit alcohol dehydrogenase family)
MAMTKTIVITGASDGIGKAAARILHAQGHQVVLIGRSRAKTEALARELDSAYYIADFSKLAEVRKLGRSLKHDYKKIDVLACNAGGIFSDRVVTVDGFERTFQVNFLAHFLLTGLLMDTLVRSHATIIATSSAANRFNRFSIDDLNAQKHYAKWAVYGNAKLEMAMFARELNRRYAKKGIASASFHPGVVSTSFSRDLGPVLRFIFNSRLMRVFGIVKPEQGADTLVWLATSEPGTDWQPGNYFYRRKKTRTDSKAYDKRLGSELWNRSEDMLSDKLEY